jgi:O-antigen ligase
MSFTTLIPLFLAIATITAIVIFLRPDWGLLVLVFMLYTRLSDVLINYYGLPSIAKYLIPLLGFVIFLRWLLYNEKPKNWGVTVGILAGYTFIAILSMLYSDYPRLSQDALILFLKDAIAVLTIIMLLQNKTNLNRVIWTLLFAGIFLGSISTFQYLTGTFTTNYFGFGQAIYESGLGYYRLTGIGIGFNAYSQRLLILIPLAIDRLWNDKKGYRQFFAAWALVVVILTVIFTFSRGAFLSLVVVLGLSTIFILSRRQIQFGGLILVIVASIFVFQFLPDQYAERLKTLSEISPVSDPQLSKDASVRGRYSENLAAWQMFLDNPLLGVGLNNYKSHYLEYSRDIGLDPRLEGRSPHSLYLEILSELGFLGMVWFIILQWVTFKGLYQAYQKFNAAGNKNFASLPLSFGVAIIGYLIAGIFLHVSHSRFFWLIYAIALSIPIVANNTLVNPQSRIDNPNSN